MSSTFDPVTRAYATIGVRPDASLRDLKKQYKRLARTWHPDKWTRDPVSQVDAAQRMRAINDAYATLHRVTRTRHAPRSGRLSDAEREEIVRAIGSVSPVASTMNFLAWFLPMAMALVPMSTPHMNPRSAGEAMRGSAILFAAGVAIWLYQRWSRRSRR